jgi:hypothetical protein
MMRIPPTLVLAVLAAALGACEPPSSRSVIAPDGQKALFVRCGSDQGACFDLAGQNCPYGYDIRAAVAGDSGAYFVRCRYAPMPVAMAPVPVPMAPPPPAPVPAASEPYAPTQDASGVPTATFPAGTSSVQPSAAAKPPAKQGWPPPNEPGATAPPWQDLDLGY